MNKKRRTILTLAFAGPFLVVGFPYWQIPYAQVSLPDAILNIGLVVVAVSAALTRILRPTRFWPTTFIVGASVPAAVVARVLYEVLLDYTSHNLWPFELILAAGPGFAAAFVGALVGGFLAGRSGT